MAVILAEKKSTYGSPYAYYKVETTNISNRTSKTVDVAIRITSHLANSSSSLGSSYNLTAGLYLNGSWKNFRIKYNESWSGTTNHITNTTITVSGLSSSATSLTGIKFRVESSASDNASGLNATACSNITIPKYHTLPLITGYTITETNQDLLDVGITDEVFVNGLSQKEFDIAYTLYDGATFSKASVYNSSSYVYQETSLPIAIDFKNNPIKVEADGIPIFVSITDSENDRSYFSNAGGSVASGSSMDYYNYIPYVPVSITTTTNAKREGQISGQVSLNIDGIYYGGIIGNVDQSSYKPIIKYKYWKYGDSEPENYTNTISSADISISDGTFSVSSLDIGSTTESDPNYFDPEYAYRIKIYVEDTFTNTESNELQIQVGEATWSEYKDRVDFKKITIDNELITTIEEYQEYTGAIASGSSATITFNITKSGYTPIGIMGVNCDGTRASFVNIFQYYITSSTSAEVHIRNTHTSSALVSNETYIKIYVAYIRS